MGGDEMRDGVAAVRIVIEPHAPADAKQVVREGVDLHNVAATGLDEWHSVSIFLRGADDEILGGALGQIWGSWLHVDFLWVAHRLRRSGHGRALLRATEQWAIERGCLSAHLETFSFQAPSFYQELGYEVFAVLDDFPPGHKKHFLRKQLVANGA